MALLSQQKKYAIYILFQLYILNVLIGFDVIELKGRVDSLTFPYYCLKSPTNSIALFQGIKPIPSGKKVTISPCIILSGDLFDKLCAIICSYLVTINS